MLKTIFIRKIYRTGNVKRQFIIIIIRAQKIGPEAFSSWTRQIV